MPDKEGAEEKTTKDVVTKRQKQFMNKEEYVQEMPDDVKNIMMKGLRKGAGEFSRGGDPKNIIKKGVKSTIKNVIKSKSVQNFLNNEYIPEEGYDVARDQGRVKPSKDKKDATTMPRSKEMEKTRKVNKGPSALERVKADIEKRYGKGAIMDVSKEELDLTKVAEAFGGFIVEKKKRSARSLTGNIPPEERGVQPDADKIVKQRVKKAKVQQGELDFSNTMRDIEGDPQSKKIQKEIEKSTGQKTREFTQTDKNVTKGNELKQSPIGKKETRTANLTGGKGERITGDVENPQGPKVKTRSRNRVLQKVRVAARSTKRPVQRLAKPLGKLAARNPFAAAIVGTDLLDRAGRMIPKPKPPKLDVGVVGRRTAG